jgi:hypothetical protein
VIKGFECEGVSNEHVTPELTVHPTHERIPLLIVNGVEGLGKAIKKRGRIMLLIHYRLLFTVPNAVESTS